MNAGIFSRHLFGAALLTLYTAGAIAAELPDAPGTQVWIGDRRLHVHCLGIGEPTVVLESGLGGTSLEWSGVQVRMAELTRTCSYDRAGYGWSDAAYNPRTALNVVKDLEKLLGFASVRGPYVLVGHSFGGLTTRLFAARNPARTAGMVLVDSTHEALFDEFEKAGIPNLFAPRDGLFQIRNFSAIPDGLPEPRRGLARSMASRARSVITLYSELRNMRLSARQVGGSGALPDVPLAVLTHDTLARAETEQALRTAEIWMRMQADLASRTSDGYLRVADESGHHIHLDRPELVIEAIAGIVRRIRRGDS